MRLSPLIGCNTSEMNILKIFSYVINICCLSGMVYASWFVYYLPSLEGPKLYKKIQGLLYLKHQVWDLPFVFTKCTVFTA